MKIEHAILGLFILGVITGYITISGFQPQPAVVTEREVDRGVIITCDSTVTPDIDINAYDVDNPTTAVTDHFNLYRKVPGGSWVSWQLGSEITNLEFGETYEFLIPGDTTTSNIKANASGKYIRWTAPCKEDTEMKIYVANDELYSSLTNKTFNSDGDAATAQAMANGDVATVKIRWKAGSDQYYGHPYLTSYPMLTDNGNHRRQYPNIMCLKLNSTAWEEPQEVYLADGTKMNRISNPTISAADGATTHIMYCYEAPVITDRDTDIYVTLEADSTAANNPVEDQQVYLYCSNLYINSDTGEVEWGVEDNNAAYTCGNGDADQANLYIS